jgi:hypothetical protein
MSTSQQQLVCDNSTLANFKQWASAISGFFATATWAQASDTGQVVWTASVLAITNAIGNGTTATYTYTLSSGPALRVGMSVVVTGCTTSGFNATVVITALGAGTFSGLNATNHATESESASGTTTAISSVPTSGNYVYEVWQPGDGLTTFYFKVEYGTNGNTGPQIRLSVGTGSSAGTLTGLTIGTHVIQVTSAAVPSTSAQYDCNFSGSSTRFAAMLWRNAPVNNLTYPQLFAIERSLDSSGAPTASYITLWTIGGSGATGKEGSFQQSLHLTLGACALYNSATSGQGGWVVRDKAVTSSASSAFGASIPIDLCTPSVGVFDYPATVLGAALGVDIADGVPLTATVYGSSRVYMPSKSGIFAYAGNNSQLSHMAVCMRYD